MIEIRLLPRYNKYKAMKTQGRDSKKEKENTFEKENLVFNLGNPL